MDISTMKKLVKGALLSAVLLLASCEQTGGGPSDTWDRAAMLEHQTQHFILPAFEHYHQKASALKSAASDLQTAVTGEHLEAVRAALQQTYLAWQWVSFLEVGPGESLALRYRSNTYPADTAAISAKAQAFSGNNAPQFQLPSTYDQQGLPALDFLIHSRTLADFQAATAVVAYVEVLATELAQLAQQAHEDWEASAASFCADAGTAAASPTNKLANDFIFHTEKELRAGKVGIPAGVFSSVAFPEKVEAVYAQRSKALFLESLQAHQMFFSGVAFDSLSTGPSFAGYLDHLDIKDGTTLLSDKIKASFEEARALSAPLPSDFAQQIQQDAFPMLDLFDALQRGVILMKVDMMQAMNIKVDYVDADGD